MTAHTPEIATHWRHVFESLPPDFGSAADVAALLARKREDVAILRKRPQEANRTAKLQKLDAEILFLIGIQQAMAEHGNVSLQQIITGYRICDGIWEKSTEAELALHFCSEIKHHLRHHAVEIPSPVAPQPESRLRRWLENVARSLPALPGLPRAVRT